MNNNNIMNNSNNSGSKPYSLIFDYKEDYLYAAVSGENDSLDVSLQFWQEIFNECENKGYLKLLVTEDFKNNISTIDMFVLGEKMTAMVPSNTIVAFVDTQSQQLELNRFAETVAYNRGGKGAAFTNFKEAEEWLLSESA